MKIDIRECNGGSQTKTQNSIWVYTSVNGDNFTFVSWREVRSFIPEAISLCVVVRTLNGTEITRLATHIAAEMSITRRSQVHLARSCDRISLPSTPMGISNYPIQCLLLWESRPGTCTRSCYSVSTSTEEGRGQNLVLRGSCVSTHKTKLRYARDPFQCSLRVSFTAVIGNQSPLSSNIVQELSGVYITEPHE